MWMRFWKGPGHPWPLSKVNVNSPSARNREHRTSPQERDEYIFIRIVFAPPLLKDMKRMLN